MFASVRNLLRVGISAVALIVTVDQGNAAIYYVDYSSGSDSANGTSTSTPFQHCPGDASATGTAASTTLAAGDTVVFKGGVTYHATTTPITVSVSGLAASRITYDGNSAGTFGTGRALLTGDWNSNNIGHNVVGFSVPQTSSNLTFKSFEIYGFGGSQTLPHDPGSAIAANGGVGILFASGTAAMNVTVDHCYFHELGYWFNSKPMGIDSIDGQAVFFLNNSGLNNILITNCEFTKISSCLEVPSGGTGTTNLTIANCFFHDYIRWGIDEPRNANGVHTDNVFIHDCIYSNYDYAYSASQWTGYGGAPHCDGWFNRGDSLTWFIDGKTLDFYNNTYINTGGDTAASGWDYNEGGTSCNFYNNVIVNNPSFALRIYVDGSGPTHTNAVVRVFNNSQYSSSAAFIYFGGLNNTVAALGNSIVAENNISELTVTGVYYTGFISSDVTNFPSIYSQNYNLYYAWPFNNSPMAFVGGGFQPTLAQSQSDWGFDLNSLTSVNPLYVSSSDLHLQINSPAGSAALNLTSLNLTGLNADKDGNARPATGPWDMGAYKYTGLIKFVSPPQLLPIKPMQ